MKLYTKEMFLIAAEKCEVSMIDAKHIINYIDEYVTPIELPNEDDIVQEAEKYPYGGREGSKRMTFIDGAKWYKKQLKEDKQ